MKNENLYVQKINLIQKWINQGFKNIDVLRTFEQVPRENFVLPEFIDKSYLDIPLPILSGQTISQPSTVVFMLDLLNIKPGQKILEIGVGSGYNAAMLATLVGKSGKVVSAEIIPELYEFAKENLKKTGIENVELILSDKNTLGYKNDAPYDRIIVTAGAPEIPEPLIDQLKEGGILLIPVGSLMGQEMIRITKIDGKLERENLGLFNFVPLTGQYGQK